MAKHHHHIRAQHDSSTGLVRLLLADYRTWVEPIDSFPNGFHPVCLAHTVDTIHV